MYSVAADQPLYCVNEKNVCVECTSCEYYKNDPGNVMGYMTMGDCQISLQQQLGKDNGGGAWSATPSAPTPKCACDD